MNVVVRSLTRLTETKWRLELAIGDLVYESQLLVEENMELESFRIIEPMVQDLLALCGLEGRFSRCFFSYLRNSAPELPWDFKDQDDNTIEQVIRHYGSGRHC